jgi:glycosyltransferase involved in cell wall biosynthesis
MNVGICDFPSDYEFPPRGYGSIERWLWAAAVGARAWGASVHLLGPSWRTNLPSSFRRSDVRLEDLGPGTVGEAELLALSFDLLIVGHEYPAHPAWRRTWQTLNCDVATFQHDPQFRHPPSTFNATTSRLYCYSREMTCRYREHSPRQELSVQLGLGEEPPPAIRGRDLLWLGRICSAKAPHLAVIAAARLGRRIRIVGPVHEPEYVRKHAQLFGSKHVEWVGELGGTAKARHLRDTAVLVYTCAPDYVEAGAAVFGDALRAGTPVAAVAWRAGTCADAALCDRTGTIAMSSDELDEDATVDALAAAIIAAEKLEPESVQAVGLDRFDPVRHFEALAMLR